MRDAEKSSRPGFDVADISPTTGLFPPCLNQESFFTEHRQHTSLSEEVYGRLEGDVFEDCGDRLQNRHTRRRNGTDCPERVIAVTFYAEGKPAGRTHAKPASRTLWNTAYEVVN